MNATVFPNLVGAEDWHSKTSEGLRLLKSATSPLSPSSRLLLSDEILDELHGMTLAEWRWFYSDQMVKHEMFATLSLFATCEGGIRKDFEWRHSSNLGQRHHLRFKQLQQNAQRHLTISSILETWRAAEKQNKWLDGKLKNLIQLFHERNVLAHGRSGIATSFTVVATKLQVIRQKWQEAVPDFQGF